MTRRNSSAVISVNGANTDVNATLIHTSIGPNASSAWLAAESTWAGSATSVCTVSACPPAWRTSAAAPSSPERPRASSVTFAARRPNRIAVSRPMPALAPVITTC